MDSLKGQLLIAGPQLADPNFAQTVVLIVEHNDEGALGLVLNRPIDVPVSEVSKEVVVGLEVEGTLFSGGPCEGPLMVVHTKQSAGEIEVVPGVFFTTDRSKIEALMRGGSEPAKYFVGYAGWSAGQLDTEMDTGSWLTTPASGPRIFDGGDEQWSRLMAEVRLGRWIDPNRIPDDPSVN